MTKFQITFNSELIYSSKSGAITAPIYLSWGDYHFPEKGWSDFVVVVLSWWSDALLKLIRDIEKEVEFSFMDGPMLLRLHLIDNEMVMIKCIDQRGIQEEIDYQATILLTDLVSQITSVSQNVLDICKENDWESDDILNLEKELGIIKKIK